MNTMPYSKEYLALGLPNKFLCLASISASLESSDEQHVGVAESAYLDLRFESLALSKENQYSKNP